MLLTHTYPKIYRIIYSLHVLLLKAVCMTVVWLISQPVNHCMASPGSSLSWSGCSFAALSCFHILSCPAFFVLCVKLTKPTYLSLLFTWIWTDWTGLIQFKTTVLSLTMLICMYAICHLQNVYNETILISSAIMLLLFTIIGQVMEKLHKYRPTQVIQNLKQS